jgi:hypothetical protein
MSLIAELKRRNVFRVGAAYAIVAWLLVEVASVVLPTFEAPEWVMKVFTFLLILGFPIALVFAWAFELTPGGVKREKDVDRNQSITDLSVYSKADLNRIALQLNQRPRKTLDFRTPADVLNESVALTG